MRERVRAGAGAEECDNGLLDIPAQTTKIGM